MGSSVKKSSPKTLAQRGGNGKSLYDPSYGAELIHHMSQGLSYEAFAGVIGVCRDTLYDWEKKHPEFRKAKVEAVEKCRLWWEKAGIEGMFMGGKDNPFQASIWIFNMKNRFSEHWRDKQHQEIETKVTLESLVGKSFNEEDEAIEEREVEQIDIGE